MGEQINRYDKKGNFIYPKQRDFVRFVLKKEWKNIYRVQLNKKNREIISGVIIVSWCSENISHRWSKSDGNEVFYFESSEDAIHFRLRWTGQIPEVTTETPKRGE